MTYKKKVLFLPIEFKYRELLSKIFLAFYAIRSGFRVYIGSSDSIFRLVKSKSIKGGIFFFKGGLELIPLKELKKKCDNFVILDEELGTVKNDYAKTAKSRIWPNTEKLIDRYYVIGKYGYEVSRNIFPEMRSKVRCTGWPRIDLWRKDKDHLFKKKTRLISKKFGEYILFSSDFGYNSQKVIDQRLNSYKYSQWKSKREQYLFEKDRAKKTFKEFNFFKKLLKNYDKISDAPLIIVRPHPAEDIEAWLNFSIKLKKIKVIYEDEITPWINASSGVIHRGCSAATQAHMRGLPIGYFVTDNSKIHETPYIISSHLFSLSDLINFCKKSLINKSLNRIKYHKEFQKMIHVNNHKLASELIVNDLLKLNTIYHTKLSGNFKDKLIDIRIYIKEIIKKILKLFSILDESLGVLPLSRKIPGGISKKEVQHFLSLIDHNNKIQVRKIFKDCIEIDSCKLK